MDRAHDRRSWTRSTLIYTDSDTPSPSCLTRARVRIRPSRAAYAFLGVQAGFPHFSRDCSDAIVHRVALLPHIDISVGLPEPKSAYGVGSAGGL
jgi:hypothetical protein